MDLEQLIADNDNALVLNAIADIIILSSTVDQKRIKLLIDKAGMLCQPKLELFLNWIHALPNGEERNMAWDLVVSREIARENYSPRDAAFKQWSLSMRSLAIRKRRLHKPLVVLSDGIIPSAAVMFLAVEIGSRKVYLNESLTSPVRIYSTNRSTRFIPSLLHSYMHNAFSHNGLFKQTDEKQLCWAIDSCDSIFMFAKALLYYLVLGVQVNMSAFPSSGTGDLYDLLKEGFLSRICNQNNPQANETLAGDMAGILLSALNIPFRNFGWEEIYRRLNKQH
jgi:hypothetical protein